MSTTTPPKAIDAAIGYADERFGTAGFLRGKMKKVFPDHWSFMLGEIALYSFIILLLTGTFLTLWFKPSMSEVVYHGSYAKLDGVNMSEAYDSTLQHQLRRPRRPARCGRSTTGRPCCSSASIMVHMLRVFFTGAYRKPREINWLIGIGLFTLGILEGLFGYSLPDDLLSGTGLRITQGVMQSIPVVGTYICLLRLRRVVPGPGLHPAPLHGARPADPGHPARARRRALHDPVAPGAHPVPRQGPQRDRSSSASRSSRCS